MWIILHFSQNRSKRVNESFILFVPNSSPIPPQCTSQYLPRQRFSVSTCWLHQRSSNTGW